MARMWGTQLFKPNGPQRVPPMRPQSASHLWSAELRATSERSARLPITPLYYNPDTFLPLSGRRRFRYV
jgi:hypothetical protein